MQPQVVTIAANHSAVERLKGWSFYEDAASTAYIRLRRAAVGGDILAHIKFASGESVQFEYDEDLISDGGVYVEEVSGSVTGVLYY